ncbi:hypothetical protein ACRASX_11205 [Flavobacterium sp. TMP13]|uniref:hypothetical protein n=1 Tax=Flavobacterium sp. TMP13 TaxID=3425950 RepID=UPI003D782564
MKTTINKESAADFLMSTMEVCETKQDLLLAFWFYWVESVTLNSLEFQKVVANAAVNKWFLIELKKEETECRHLLSHYPNTAGKDKDWLWCQTVSKLMSRFPKALLEAAKKREQKPRTTKVAGIRIEMSIINQN